jgi:hypothetical protein
MNPPTTEATPSEKSWWRRLRVHPIFPLLCILPLTQAIRDEYPFSHYPMYSQPTDRDLYFQYLADANGKPIAALTHTGISPSQLGKKYSRHKSILIKKEEKRTGQKLDDLQDGELAMKIKGEAANVALVFLREQSLKRKPGLQLNGEIQLIEVALGFGDGKFTERQRLLARLPALP